MLDASTWRIGASGTRVQRAGGVPAGRTIDAGALGASGDVEGDCEAIGDWVGEAQDPEHQPGSGTRYPMSTGT
jgi:hypothetical protein